MDLVRLRQQVKLWVCMRRGVLRVARARVRAVHVAGAGSAPLAMSVFIDLSWIRPAIESVSRYQLGLVGLGGSYHWY